MHTHTHTHRPTHPHTHTHARPLLFDARPVLLVPLWHAGAQQASAQKPEPRFAIIKLMSLLAYVTTGRRLAPRTLTGCGFSDVAAVCRSLAIILACDAAHVVGGEPFDHARVGVVVGFMVLLRNRHGVLHH